MVVDVSIGAAENGTCEWNHQGDMHIFISITQILSKVHGGRLTPTSGSLNASCATFPPTFGSLSQSFQVFYRTWVKLPIHVLDHRASDGSFDGEKPV